MQQNLDPHNLDRMIVLSSTFEESPRFMHPRTQDAFYDVRKYGRSDLFITITTNLKWPEIMSELLKGFIIGMT